MPQNDPCFLFYTNDMLSGTQFFTDEQVGKYIRLLMAQHQHGHLTEKQMLQICKIRDPEIWKKFKTDRSGNFFNERLENEILRRKKYTDSRANNKKGKTKPESKENENICSTYVPHMETVTETVIEIDTAIDTDLEKKREKFLSYKPKIISDKTMSATAQHRYRVEEIEFHSIVEDFFLYKNSTKKFLEYKNEMDIRDNILNYIPFYKQYRNKHHATSGTNSKTSAATRVFTNQRRDPGQF